MITKPPPPGHFPESAQAPLSKGSVQALAHSSGPVLFLAFSLIYKRSLGTATH